MMLLDFYHAAEYVQHAANLIHGEGTADAKILAAQWAQMMKHREDGVRSILKAMRYHRDKMPRGKARSTCSRPRSGLGDGHARVDAGSRLHGR
jgi:hypothetical protein